MPSLSDFTQEAQIAARSLADYVGGRGLRLGVTGLSRSGKTVFITALVHNLLRGGRLPVLQAHSQGRLRRRADRRGFRKAPVVLR